MLLTSTAQFVYDCVNKTSPSYGTRQLGKYDICIIHKNAFQYGLRSVRYFGAKCWNTIPMRMKVSPSVAFANNSKQFS